MKLEQIDWVKELEEDEELVEWLETDKSLNSPLENKNWWRRRLRKTAKEVEEVQNNIVFKGLMKKLNR